MFLVVVYLSASLPLTLAASNAICRLCKAAEIQTVYQTISKKEDLLQQKKNRKKNIKQCK